MHYTLQFSNTVPVGTVIENHANVNYTENTNKTAEGETIPIQTEAITLTISYSSTTVIATKTGPDHVLCGEQFNYVLTFANTGQNVATGVSVQDNLPTGFVVNVVTVKNGNKILTRGTNYEYTDGANPLVITSIGNGLNIASNSQLIVTVSGQFPCTN